ncbi:PREDICTED: solute carrier family 17 member 9 isoform X2 [Propithecus coquereli]|uniref:solute carrier family 17 member 9 isoform X2 n=1 Tax=Propithecus coquereli TaxID=379532 RepID=UPI00063F99B9|nr:PREDICTED: solute carrier family 17 member 9 isoform X2 [Propithecus coquereli]
MQPPLDEARRDTAEDTQWSRPQCQAWTGALLLGTCLLYCARASVPVCTVAMSQDFGWNKKEAGIVLSSFFWGYCLTQVVGGHLGDRIGGEKVIVLSASAWGSITAATPLLAHLGGAHLVCMTLSRVLMGLLQGVYFPALTSLLSQKVRESERAFTYSTVGAGSQIGTLLTGVVGSALLEWHSWQSVFYFSGSLTLLWAWYVHRYLLREKDLVLALGVLVRGLPVSRHSKVPWRQLFRKPSVWAAVFSQLCSACSFFILLSWLPTFFQETFPHAKGWVFNVVPWLVAIPASVFSGFLSDHLICQAILGGTHAGAHAGSTQWAHGNPLLWPPPVRLQAHRGAEVHAGDGPRPVGHFRPVSGSHLELLRVRGLCVSLHWPPDLQPQRHFREHPGLGPVLRRFPVWCGQHSRRRGRCGGRVSGRLPDRDHRLLDLPVQPSGRHQQPGAVHLPGVRAGPEGGPEPRPRGSVAPDRPPSEDSAPAAPAQRLRWRRGTEAPEPQQL